MNLPHFTLLLWIVVAGMAVERAFADDGKVTAESLQGTWRCLGMEYNGVKKEFPIDSHKRLVVKKGKWTWDSVELDLVVSEKGTPTEIDTISEGRRTLGICKFEDGKLIVCLNLGKDSMKRPAAFKSVPGTNHHISIYERESK